MPQNEPYKSTPYYQRIKEAVDDIHSRTTETKLDKSIRSINDNGLYMKTVSALVKGGILMNYGSQRVPTYVWNASTKLTDEVYEYVYKYIKQYNRKHITEHRIERENMPPENHSTNNIPKMNYIYNFTDEELWEELKKRGFEIKDNELRKIICFK